MASYVRRLPAGTAIYARPWPEMARKALGHHYGCDPARSADRSGFMGFTPQPTGALHQLLWPSLGLWLEKDEFCCFQDANSHRDRYRGPVWDKEAGAAERCEPNLGSCWAAR